ncbi:MAG: hypothetical protein OEX02_02600 [Cyclobacteriaceae bacterium]|nr:hypothetical protein [Cyclobacteriaceae bacterium]
MGRGILLGCFLLQWLLGYGQQSYVGFGIGGYLSNQYRDIEQAMINSGFNDLSPGIYSLKPAEHPFSKLNPFWSVDILHFFSSKGLGFTFARSGGGVSYGYNNTTNSYLFLHYSCTVVGGSFAVMLGKRHFVSIGTGLNVLQYEEEASSSTALGFDLLPGLMMKYMVNVVNWQGYFLAFKSDIQLMPKTIMGPFRSTRNSPEFLASEVHFSHIDIGLCFGKRF